MTWFDLNEEQLREYRVTTPEPPELDAWWTGRIERARRRAQPASVVRHQDELYGELPVYDVEFSGDDGERVHAWYLRPVGTEDAGGGEPLPVVVTFLGYGADRGLPVEHTAVPVAGYAQLVVDTRGQGGALTRDTADPGAGPQYPSLITRGILDPDTYYYSRVYVDAVRAVDTAAELPGVDPELIAVSGASQGGGLALAAAALSGDLVKVCQADVPFLCDFQRAITVSPATPYAEIARYIAAHPRTEERVRDTLRYVDAALLARRITADTLVTVGLMDEICPPSTVYGAFHEIGATREIHPSPFRGHPIPRSYADVMEHTLRHLRTHLKR
ncbi:acetylxylan esterase [Streptomyces sp. NPDC091265]|uniref:acetylxylan esterase n=1 Tax=unclassified Streptomyces TaxID=2593676 RepID=UPI00344CE125